MPVRLTPHGSLLITYDSKDKSWVSIDGISMCMLSENVDIVPGVTLQHVFRIVDRDMELKRFLTEYCACDIDMLHARPLNGDEDIIVGLRVECVNKDKKIYQFVEAAPADAVSIAPISWVSTDRTGDRQFRYAYMLQARSFQDWQCAANLGQYRDKSFARLCSLPLRLDTLFEIVESDRDNLSEDGTEDTVFRAHIRYTLFDVLTTIYKFFGNPFFDPRDQREIDDDEGVFQQGEESEKGGEGEGDD